MGRKAGRNGLQRTGDHPQHPMLEEEEDENEEDSSAVAVWTPAVDLK